MKKISILMLHLQHGGIEKQTITLANELSKKYEVEIISTYSMLCDPAYDVDEKVRIKYLMDDRPNRDEFKSAIKSKNIAKIIRQGIKAVKILFLKRKLMIKAIKALDCNYVLSTRIEFAELLSKYAPKNVVTMTQEHMHDGSCRYIDRARKAFKNLDYLLVLCDWSRENFSEWLKDNKKIKIVQIPNILEEIPEESACLAGNKIVSAGRLHPVKNFRTLIEVFDIVKEKIPSAELTIIGGGDEYARLNTFIKERGLEQSVTITGMVSAEDVKKHMLSSDLYVMTSHTECFPMVLLEASSVGIPLIAFDVPVGPRAIISNGFNGYLVEYMNIREMADRVIEVLTSREKLKDFGNNAKLSSKQYLAENIMPQWYALFD
ncbi:MAG: glycosyltransferase [Clostridia bacterium]|nr:glycosyltransferase [Clostridia bacterium]